MIIAVSGLPGTGKSYFAKRLADQLDTAFISSDKVRREILSQPGYTPGQKSLVYDEMLGRMRKLAAEGKSVVLDATFSSRHQRQNFRNAALAMDQSWFLIYLTAEEDLIKQRVGKKRKHSDAGFDIYLKLKEEYDPIYQKHLELESRENNVQEMIREARQYIGGR